MQSESVEAFFKTDTILASFNVCSESIFQKYHFQFPYKLLDVRVSTIFDCLTNVIVTILLEEKNE